MASEKWTVMAYLAGDNNLTDNCVYSLNEMKEVGSDELINIFAQFDPQDEFLQTHRYRIRKRSDLARRSDAGDGNPEDESANLNEDIIATAGRDGFNKESPIAILNQRHPDLRDGETDTGSPITLRNFITFSIDKGPADHYLLVLSGHGAGTEQDYLLRDDAPSGYLTIPEFKEVFSLLEQDRSRLPLTAAFESNKPIIEILGLDSCLMSMAEICYEMKGLVSIIVGSESYSPASGWPYRQILESLKQASAVGANPERVAASIVEEYVKGYIDYSLGGLSVDLSAIRVPETEGLKEEVKELARVLKEELIAVPQFKDALILAHWEAQSYNGELFVDLFDFCDCLENKYAEDRVRTVCENVKNFIRDQLVILSCFSGPRYQFSNGISIYFPWSSVDPYYKENLSFARDSNWADFLETYVEITRRDPRRIGIDDDRWEQLLDNNRLVSKPNRRSSGKGPANPVYSMRNPPITGAASSCIRPLTGLFEGASLLIDRMREQNET